MRNSFIIEEDDDHIRIELQGSAQRLGELILKAMNKDHMTAKIIRMALEEYDEQDHEEGNGCIAMKKNVKNAKMDDEIGELTDGVIDSEGFKKLNHADKDKWLNKIHAKLTKDIAEKRKNGEDDEMLSIGENLLEQLEKLRKHLDED